MPVSTAGGFEPRWSRDGRELFYVAGQGVSNYTALMAVDVQTGSTFHVSRPRELFKLPRGGYDVAPDGKRFLLVVRGSGVPEPASKLNAVVDWFEDLRRRAPLKK